MFTASLALALLLFRLVQSSDCPCPDLLVLFRQLSNHICDPLCSSPECAWDSGDCGFCAADCTRHAGFQGNLGNNVCEAACACEACAWDAGDCAVLFVTAESGGADAGTLTDPFWTLAEALAAVTTNATMIELLAGTHALTALASGCFVGSLTDALARDSPLDVTIEGLLCSRSSHPHCAQAPPILRFDDRSPVHFHFPGLITLRNVALTGGTAGACVALCSGVDFLVATAGIRAEGVSVRDFHPRFRSVFSVSGAAFLTGVEFVSVTTDSAAIQQSSGALSLAAVTFRLLSRALVQTTGATAVVFSRVSAELCLTQTDSALFQLADPLFAQISASSFRNCVGEVLAITESLKLSLEIAQEADAGIYSSRHLSVTDCDFENNTGAFVLSIKIRGDILNINLTNVTFISNLAVESAIVAVEVMKGWEKQERDGDFLPFLVSGALKTLFAPRRNFTFSSVALHSNFAPRVFYLTQVANVAFLNVSFVRNSDSLRDFLVSNALLVTSQFTGASFSVSADDVHCYGTLYINSSFRTAMRDAAFSENSCGGGAPTLFAVALGDSFLLQHSAIHSNYAPSATVASVSASCVVLLDSVSIRDNRVNSTAATGILYLSTAGVGASFVMNNTVVAGNWASEGGAVRVTGSFSVINSTFRGNSCVGESAAALNFSPSIYSARLDVSAVRFRGNYGKNAGAVSLFDKMSVRVPILLTVADTDFEANVSEGPGSCLLLDSSIGLTTDSEVRNSRFIGNSAVNGCVWTSYYSGILSISSSVFRLNRANNTSAIYGQHPKSTATVASFISLRDSLFEYNSGFSTVFMINPEKYTEGRSSNLTVASNAGRGFYLQYTFWTDSGSRFYNNSSPTSGPAFVLLFYSEVSLRGTVFTANSAKLTGGTITMGILSKVNISECVFVGNFAERGGAIFGEQGVAMKLSNCTFRGNTSNKEGAAMYFLTGPLTSVNSTIISTRFLDNISLNGQGAVALISSFVYMEDCFFQGNRAKTAPGILVVLSVLTMVRSTCSGQSSAEGAFLYSAAGASINISACVFRQGFASEKGGALFFSATTVWISSSDFQGLRANYGSAIAAYSETNLRVSTSRFWDQTAAKTYGGTIFFNESPLSSYVNTFSNCTNGILVGEVADLDIRGSLFESATSKSGAAVYCRDCSSVSVSDSTFRGLSAESGACIHLLTSLDSALLNVSGSTFLSSVSHQTGAVLVENEDAVFASCHFCNNSAAGSSGDGGALHLACASRRCSFVVSHSTFASNTATHNGGAVFWSDWEPLMENCSFEDNSAPYGPDIASFAIALRESSDQVARQVPSGQTFSGTISAVLVDHYGQVVATDNSSLADLLPVFASNTTISGLTRMQAVTGEFRFSTFSVTYKPGSVTLIRVETSGIDLTKDRADPARVFLPSVITASVEIALEMRACEVGETLVGAACYVCPEGKYSLEPSSSCANCPTGAVCLGNCTMAPKRGYWRSHNSTDVFLECPNTNACLGSPVGAPFTATGVCATGYYGNLCHGCLSGYSRSGNHNCASCPNNAINGIQIAGVIVAFTLVVVFIIKMSLVSAHKQQSHGSIFLKIFVNYLQLTAAASSFNLNWPQTALQAFRVRENASDVSTQLFSFDCFVDTGAKDNQADTVFIKTIVAASIPLFIIAASVTFWGAVSLIRRTKGYLKYQLINSIVVMFFVSHPSIISLMFDVFNCRELDAGEYWLNSYLNIRCWDSRHSRYALLVALPALVVWGVFTPLLALLTLVALRRKLFFLEMRIRFGFLYTGYIVSKYYWEFVIMYRKMIVIALVVFMTTMSATLQALGVLLVLVISLVSHVYNSPYNAAVFNQLEKRSILVSTVTLYCGLFYMTKQLNFAFEMILFATILLVNFYFLAMWFAKTCEAGCMLLVRRFPFMSRIYVTASYLVNAKRVAPSESLSVDLSVSFDRSNDKRGEISAPYNSVIDGSSVEQPQITPTLGHTK